MSEIKKGKQTGVRVQGDFSKKPVLKALTGGALDEEEHWWLPPPDIRANLRKYLSTAEWNRTVLFTSFLQFTFILGELVTTILEPIYPPTSQEEKMMIGIILLGSEMLGAILNLFLTFELWAWTLGFGWKWWLDLRNIVETATILVDIGLRLWYTGPMPVARCFHLVVLVKILARFGRYVQTLKRESVEEAIHLRRQMEKGR